MRTFEQLTFLEQQRAIRASLGWLVDGLVCGMLEIDLPDPNSQTKLIAIVDDAVRNSAPRLGKLRILNCRPIAREIRKLAVISAEEQVYNSSGDRIIGGNLQ